MYIDHFLQNTAWSERNPFDRLADVTIITDVSDGVGLGPRVLSAMLSLGIKDEQM